MRAAFVTVGDTARLTGGYLYHARVFPRLAKFGIEVEEMVASGASVEEQESGVEKLRALDPKDFDVVVVDALARVVCATFIGDWRDSRPVVAMVHELPSVAAPEENEARERDFEDALLKSDLLIAVSGHGRSALEDRGVPFGRIRVVPPGFDGLGMVRETRRGGPPVALCVAQWIERKGILDLILAWKIAEVPDASLHLVGETNADPEYSARVIEAIGDDASVKVSGTLDDKALASAYAQSDLFVLPSRYEGYGIVYAEALSFSLPIVACDVGPVPELVGEEVAVLVPPGDAGELARALRHLLSDEGLRRRMSEAALRRAENLPRWEDATRGFAEVLKEAAGRG
ncbi:MAG: glycosyltransferase family 4 protein [Rubrobacteraceae bacterium]